MKTQEQEEQKLAENEADIDMTFEELKAMFEKKGSSPDEAEMSARLAAEYSVLSDADKVIYMNTIAELSGNITDDMPPEQKARVLKQNEIDKERHRVFALSTDEAIKHYANLGKQEEAEKQKKSLMYRLGKGIRKLL